MWRYMVDLVGDNVQQDLLYQTLNIGNEGRATLGLRFAFG